MIALDGESPILNIISLFPLFSDYGSSINMASTVSLLAGFFALVIWILAKNYGVLLFYSIVGGAAAGVFWAVSYQPPELYFCQQKNLVLS